MRRVTRPLLAVLLLTACAAGQGVITTIAGTDSIFTGDNVPALQAPLSGSLGFGVWVDSRGNLLVADGGNHAIYRIGPDRLLSTVAGNGIPAFSGDGGPARAASLLSPQALVSDARGNIYIAEAGNNDIRRVTPEGIISTIAGNGIAAFSGDGGPATAASINYPETIAIDSAGNLYVGSITDSRIRKITPSGQITTVAGNGQQDYSGDGGPATRAAINYPEGLAVDAAGNLYIADTLNFRIRKVTPAGVITTVAGGGFAMTLDSVPAIFALIAPTALTFDPAGNLVFFDFVMRRIAKLTPDGAIVTVAGTGTAGVSGDGGPALKAQMTLPTSLSYDTQGNLYIAESASGTIRVITPNGNISRYAGNGAPQFGGDNGPALFAKMNLPQAVDMDAAGNLYIADSLNHRIRKIDPQGVITTVAGTGNAASEGNGSRATQADIWFPAGLAVARDGTIYFSEQISGYVRKVTPTGIVDRVAGQQAAFNAPTALDTDAAGNLYIVDSGNNRVRKIDTYGTITTVAGGGVSPAEGVPATSAALKFTEIPSHGGGIAVDAQGNIFISDTYNHRVRRITPAGIISTIAGTARAGYSGDNGPAVSAALNTPLGLAFDRDGGLLIADQNNHRIRKVLNGTITTVAGNGRRSFNGDGGLARDAAMRSPADVVVDARGNIFIADQYNSRIRAVLATPPSFDVDTPSLRFTARSGGAPTQPGLVTVNSNIPGVQFSTSTTTSGGGNWLQINPSAGATPRLLEISANPAQVAPGTYTGQITISAPTANPRTRTVAVTLEVTPGPAPALDVDKPNLSFTFANGATGRSDVISVLNTGGGILDFTATASTVTGGDWLKLSATSGKATPAAPAIIAISADPTGLAAGSYRGEVTLTGANGDTRAVAVTMTVSTFDKGLLLTQSGLSFTAVAGGGAVPPQTFGILNIGRGLISWTLSPSTLSGGDWLSVSTTGGQTESSLAAPLVEVRVNPAGLPPGSYYGLIRVDYGVERTDNPDAANSPQMVTVFLEVLPQGSDPGALIRPGELVFTAVSGGDFPGAQEVLLYNVSSSAKSFRSVISDGPDNFSLAAPPRDGTLLPGEPTRIVVQPRVDDSGPSADRTVLTLKPGVYTRELSFQFSDGRVRGVPVRLIVAPAGTVVSKSSGGKHFAAGCTPNQLVPAMTSLGQSFAVSAGWPVALSAEVRDDCGTPMDDGFVSVSFSNGDPPVLLEPLKQGRWQGSWATRSSSRSQVTLRLEAVQPQANIRGSREVSGDLRSAQDAPITDKGHVMSAASMQPFVPIAPGSRIAIVGERLAESSAAADALPLPTNLAGTEVLIAGRSMPLVSVSQGQLVGIVPSGINPNTSQQILIRRGTTLSRPVAVDVAPAQPAVLREANRPIVLHASGTGPDPAYVTADAPAEVGESLVIYSAGLGLTNPQVPDGAGAPPDAPAPTAESVQVTLGGVEAPVSFAGLAPGMPGTYVINLKVPEGVPTGSEAAVVIRVAGQFSPPVTIPIR